MQYNFKLCVSGISKLLTQIFSIDNKDTNWSKFGKNFKHSTRNTYNFRLYCTVEVFRLYLNFLRGAFDWLYVLLIASTKHEDNVVFIYR
jgi:hypothetical protein